MMPQTMNNHLYSQELMLSWERVSLPANLPCRICHQGQSMHRLADTH